MDVYNPWYGSVDIDLVTNHTTKSSLMWHLLNNRGYEHYRAHGSRSVAKNTSDGPIIIDFLSKDFDFLKECLKRIPDNYDALAKYEKMDRETARETCEKLLLLLQ